MKIMTHFNKALLLIVSFGIVLIPSCKPKDMSLLLPDSDEDLLKKGKAEVYIGDKLYNYIDGAAEIYFQHQFVKCVTQNYRLVEANQSVPVKVEIYQMKTSENAESLFDDLYGNEVKSAGIGTKSIQDETNDQEIAFCLDKYLCSLIAYQKSDLAKGKLLALAKKIASRIRKAKE